MKTCRDVLKKDQVCAKTSKVSKVTVVVVSPFERSGMYIDVGLPNVEVPLAAAMIRRVGRPTPEIIKLFPNIIYKPKTAQFICGTLI